MGDMLYLYRIGSYPYAIAAPEKLTDKHIARLIHIDLGRSGSRFKQPQIRELPVPAALRNLQGCSIGGMYDVALPKSITKTNPDPRINAIERTLYERLGEQGISVPKILGYDATSLEMEYLGSEWDRRGMLRNHIGRVHAALGAGLLSPLQVYKDNERLAMDVVRFVARVDDAVDRSLSTDDKNYLLGLRDRSLAREFGLSVEEVLGKQHALRVMGPLGIRDPGFTQRYALLERILQGSEQSFGQWTWGAHVCNIYTTDGKRFTAADFNNPTFGVPQESDAYLIDAYLPIKDLNNLDLNPTIFHDDIVPSMVEERKRLLKEQGRLAGVDDDAYLSALGAARVERGVRQFGHSLDELSVLVAEKRRGELVLPGDIYDRVQEAGLSLRSAMGNLAMLANGHPSLAPLVEEIRCYANARMGSAVPPTIYAQVLEQISAYAPKLYPFYGA
jgi:hypothetical protein